LPISTVSVSGPDLSNEELVPADAVVLSGNAQIDYSFVTGESIFLKRKDFLEGSAIKI